MRSALDEIVETLITKLSLKFWLSCRSYIQEIKIFRSRMEINRRSFTVHQRTRSSESSIETLNGMLVRLRSGSIWRDMLQDAKAMP